MNHHQALAVLTTATGWRKSSYSVQNSCVEVTTELPGWVGVHDSKLGLDSPVLACTRSQWRATLTAALDV